MVVSVSDYIGVDADRFAETGAFDAVLDVDAKLFIDPHLLKSTDTPELRNSYEKVKKRFSNILKLLEISKFPGDVPWRNAARLFHFPEVEGLCIGYSSKSTSGSGMGRKLRTQLLKTAKTIVDAGIKDPEMFELMVLFESGVGADRMSDMVAGIILDDLLNYSQRIFAEMGIERLQGRPYQGKIYKLPINSHNSWPIILVPKDILRNLPMAFEVSDIDEVIDFNQTLRQRFNSLIGVTWKEARRLKKQDYKRFVLDTPEILGKLVELYRELPAKRYDFEKDPDGQIAWYRAGKKFSDEYPLKLYLSSFPTTEEILDIVLKICEQFKQYIENNGGHTLLYRDDDCTNPKREEAAQKLFLGMADAYCKANDLDLSPETNSGRGFVDFKLSHGYANRVIVETKLTTNSNLLHGYETQLEEYKKAEKTDYSVYIVIDVGGSRQRLERLRKLVADRAESHIASPYFVLVNGKRKPSASRYHTSIKVSKRNYKGR